MGGGLGLQHSTLHLGIHHLGHPAGHEGGGGGGGGSGGGGEGGGGGGEQQLPEHCG